MAGAFARFTLHVAVSLIIFHALLRPMCACSPVPSPPASDDALYLAATVLQRSDRLYGSVVGIEGSIPPEAFAWRLIAQSRAADSVFRALFRTGTRPAQLYALVWLRNADPQLYNRSALDLRRGEDEIETQHGCIVARQRVRDVLAEIDRGDWTAALWSVPLWR